MEENIKYFVHNNEENYTSYSGIKGLMIFICWFLTFMVGTAAIVAKLWLYILILIVINCLFLLHLFLLKFFYKKTYAFRFISEGIINLLLSSLFLTTAYIILDVNVCDTSLVKYGTLILYTILGGLSIPWTIARSKSNVYRKYIQSKKKEKRAGRIFGALIPVSGVIGMAIARIIIGVFNFEKQILLYIGFVISILVSMIFFFGYVYFLKYYYCIRYNIFCDENGNSASPLLEPNAKSKKKRKNPVVTKNKRLSIPKKMLKFFLVLTAIIFSLFLLLLLVIFLKAIILQM